MSTRTISIKPSTDAQTSPPRSAPLKVPTTAARTTTIGAGKAIALWLTIGMFIAGLALSAVTPSLTLLPCAFLFGWTQVGGLCGTAHVNTMVFLRRRSKSLWLSAALLYVVAGLCSATAVGLIVGATGKFLGGRANSPALLFVAGLGAVLTARESGLLNFRLLEWRCQTERTWAYDYGFRWASAMWGFHIGLGFFTVITYGGFYLLVAYGLVSGDPFQSMAIMGTYWMGRSLPLLLLPPVGDTRILRPANTYTVFRPFNSVALIWSTILMVILFVRQ